MPIVQTVLGPIEPQVLGPTLVHEHVMCDFIGADQTGPHRWERGQVVQRMAPYLHDLVKRGIRGFVDCTPMYLGRDVQVLARLSELTGLHILTNTGLYKEPYLPAEVFAMAPKAVAEGWIREWEDGIDGTDIRPGFIKIAVYPGPLLPMQQAIVRAAALTHLATGLTIACHTGHDLAAEMSLEIIESEGMDPRRYIIVHADQIPDLARHVILAQRGAWLEYDSIGARPIEAHVRLVLAMLDKGYEDQLLISQDAGWYHVGEPEGGEVRAFTDLTDRFIPALREAGATEDVIQKLLTTNPARAFTQQMGVS